MFFNIIICLKENDLDKCLYFWLYLSSQLFDINVFLAQYTRRFSSFLILCKIRNTETHNKWFIEGSIYHEPHSFLMLLLLDIGDILFLSTAWTVQSKFIISQSFSVLSIYRISNYFSSIYLAIFKGCEIDFPKLSQVILRTENSHDNW